LLSHGINQSATVAILSGKSLSLCQTGKLCAKPISRPPAPNGRKHNCAIKAVLVEIINRVKHGASYLVSGVKVALHIGKRENSNASR
jgi:hypothetical protein